MLRRSDFIAATYALSLVLANFGIAIAARMPMMTTTIRSSMRVKPFLLLILNLLKRWDFRRRAKRPSAHNRRDGLKSGNRAMARVQQPGTPTQKPKPFNHVSRRRGFPGNEKP